ncbi:ankyrin repeat domain-containing protein [Xenorhabdus stockiae]|uniref:ankyrin repeat domain-containing protein n=1 Tax=Xenorhabdus stockiae TaxID=351614 RepID=UPI004064805E
MKFKYIPIYFTFLFCLLNVNVYANPLHDAVNQNDIETVKSLLNDDQTLLDERDGQQRTPLMLATRHNYAAIAIFLIQSGADVNAKDRQLDTPYLLAGAQGYNKILIATLHHGANLKDTNRYGGTALIPAAEKGHPETVQILLDAGVNPNHINKLGWTALMEAVVLGNGSSVYVDIIDRLIKGGANVNIPDKNGVTALTHARQRGYKDIIKLLESANAK